MTNLTLEFDPSTAKEISSQMYFFALQQSNVRMMNSGARRFAFQKSGSAITMMIVVTVLMRKAVTSLQVKLTAVPVLNTLCLFSIRCACPKYVELAFRCACSY